MIEKKDLIEKTKELIQHIRENEILERGDRGWLKGNLYRLKNFPDVDVEEVRGLHSLLLGMYPRTAAALSGR